MMTFNKIIRIQEHLSMMLLTCMVWFGLLKKKCYTWNARKTS